MNLFKKHPSKRAIRAFNEHRLITLKLNDGKAIGPGHIVIMYGDVAFRMLEKNTNESHFIRTKEIAEIIS